jgi:hypothetical protein
MSYVIFHYYIKLRVYNLLYQCDYTYKTQAMVKHIFYNEYVDVFRENSPECADFNTLFSFMEYTCISILYKFTRMRLSEINKRNKPNTDYNAFKTKLQ